MQSIGFILCYVYDALFSLDDMAGLKKNNSFLI